MTNKSPEQLIQEYRDIVKQRAPLLRSKVGGQRGFLELQLQARQEDYKLSAARWAHLAHLGTLDKLEALFASDVEHSTFELLAIARNLMENLIWLRLINQNLGYGLVFYARYLEDLKKNQSSYIRKLKDEADLFVSMGDVEQDARNLTLKGFNANSTEEEARRAMDEHRAQAALLDDMVRREFSLFANSAFHNGYGWQADILVSKIIPQHEAELLTIESDRADLFEHLPALVNSELLDLATGNRRWNWSSLATAAHMSKAYDLLYGFTSRLLHASPLNIISDKKLSDSEAMVVLDYAVITALDLFEAIESFSHPDQIDAISIDISDGETLASEKA